jgi:hypothetical protein
MRELAGIEAADLDVAFVGNEERREDLEERRLAAAVGPQDAKDIACVGVQGEAAERAAISVGVRNLLDGEDHRLRSSTIKT